MDGGCDDCDAGTREGEGDGGRGEGDGRRGEGGLGDCGLALAGFGEEEDLLSIGFDKDF